MQKQKNLGFEPLLFSLRFVPAQSVPVFVIFFVFRFSVQFRFKAIKKITIYAQRRIGQPGRLTGIAFNAEYLSKQESPGDKIKKFIFQTWIIILNVQL